MNLETKKVREKIKDAMKRFDQLSLEEKCEVENKLNAWKWDERLGEKPERWDKLKDFSLSMLIPRVTKHSYIWPIILHAKHTVGTYELFKWHHLHNCGRTEEEFETWWKSNGARVSMY